MNKEGIDFSIKDLRIHSGMRQKDMADMLKMTQPQLSKLENPNFGVNIDTLVHVSVTFGYEVVVKPTGWYIRVGFPEPGLKNLKGA